MKITLYELLGLVKDGKAPKKIKFRNEIYEYKNNIEDGFIDYVGIEKETNERFYLSSNIGNNYISDIFTDEVEIIEEDKKIEKLDKRVLSQNLMIADSNAPIDEKWKLGQKLIYDNSIEIEKVKNKLNELIEEIEKLKGKSE